MANEKSDPQDPKEPPQSEQAATRADSQPNGETQANSKKAPNAPPAQAKPAAWGRPLKRLDEVWTRFEMRLCAVVLALQVCAFTVWVALKGMSAEVSSESNVGIVFRAVIGALALGSLAWWGLRKQSLKVRRIATLGGVGIGFFAAKAWVGVGVEYSANLLNWYQQASSLTLLGGLRGVGTRLTLLLALLGGSLATGAGKHITIDVVTRMVKPAIRRWMVVASWLLTSVICFVASWGFFDHVAIESFGAKKDDSASQKISTSFEAIGENLFILRKQIGLDFKTLPHVVKGEAYSRYLNGAEWNTWLDEAGFAERYGQEQVDNIKLEPDSIRSPIVVIPGKGEPRGELISTANLVFPIGLFIIAVRFILLSLLVISGHRTTEPDDEAPAEPQPEDSAGGNPPPEPPPPPKARDEQEGSEEGEAGGPDSSSKPSSEESTKNSTEESSEPSEEQSEPKAARASEAAASLQSQKEAA